MFHGKRKVDAAATAAVTVQRRASINAARRMSMSKATEARRPSIASIVSPATTRDIADLADDDGSDSRKHHHRHRKKREHGEEYYARRSRKEKKGKKKGKKKHEPESPSSSRRTMMSNTRDVESLRRLEEALRDHRQRASRSFHQLAAGPHTLQDAVHRVQMMRAFVPHRHRDVSAYCAQCGAPAGSAISRFCAKCGASR